MLLAKLALKLPNVRAKLERICIFLCRYKNAEYWKNTFDFNLGWGTASAKSIRITVMLNHCAF